MSGDGTPVEQAWARWWAQRSEAERARLHALRGQTVTVATPELTEDADGSPLGVELQAQGAGAFHLPACLFDDEDDTEGPEAPE